MVKKRRFDSYEAKQFLKRHIPEQPLPDHKNEMPEHKIEKWMRILRSAHNQPEKRKQARVWNYAAKTYLKMVADPKYELHVLQTFFKEVKLDPTSKVLFLGSGIGIDEAFVASRFPRGKFTFLDFSKEMHKLAKGVVEKEKLQNVKFLRADMEKIPLKKKSQDAICVFGVTAYLLKQNPALVREAREVISDSPNARLVFDLSSPYVEDINSCRHLLEENGFKVEKHIIHQRDQFLYYFFLIAKPK